MFSAAQDESIMIKKLLIFLPIFCGISLCFGYPKQNPFPPFRIIGNVYYVGADDLASYLIVTPKGNILINSNLESDVPMIKASIEKLGFKYSDTKILLVSHAHFDHAAGSKIIKDQTHAQYFVMDADASLVETGGRNDFHYANDKDTYFSPTKIDKILHDGDQVKLGDTTLTAHLTAGHTPGCTSWSMQVNDHGKSYQVVFVGSLSVNPGYKLVHNKNYPNIAKDYVHAIKELKSLHADVFLGAHAGYFDLKKKYALLNKTANNPFVDPEGYKNYISQKENEFNNELKKQI